jgi:molybdopterin-biosynthesis enzyme MoeA-like protein
MRAVALIAVGRELLRFDRQDTNAGWLTEQLARHGVAVRGRCQVEDDERSIAGAVHCRGPNRTERFGCPAVAVK